MFNLILKDLIIQKKSLYIGLLYILMFMFVFQSMGNMMFTSAIVAFTYILVMGAFAYDDKNKSDMMLNSFPVKRKNIVLAKYLSLFLYIAIGTATYMIIYQLLTAARLPVTAYPVSLPSLIGAVFAVCLMNSICFPLIFKMGYIKAKIINMVFFFSIFFGVPLIVNSIAVNNRTELLSNIDKLLSKQSDAFIAFAVIAASFVLIFISYILSVRFYRKREF